MLDNKIKLAAEVLGIRKPEDWQKVTPQQVREVEGCGSATVDHLRIYLAARGMTLRDDATPRYWQENLSATRIGGQLGGEDRGVHLPFTIIIDSQEQLPFTFEGYRADADQNYRPLICTYRFESLGPSHGDYSMAGYQGRCHVERKSMNDAHGTFLAAPGTERADRWLRTLEFLAGIETAAVVVECTFGVMITSPQARGKRDRKTLAKILHRQVLAWEQDFRVPFIFCDSRRLAELTTLNLMRRHYRKATSSTEAQSNDSDLDAAIAAL